VDPAAAKVGSAAAKVDSRALQTLLETRRSIFPKDYTGAPVSDEQVRALLGAAPWAPNHGKTQPWRFVVFGGAAIEKLLDATLAWHLQQPPDFWKTAFIHKGQPEFADGAAFAAYYEKAAGGKWRRASHLIAICMRRQRPSDKKQIPEWEEMAATACAVHNMHLLATSLQLGAYWSSWYELYRKSDECVSFLGLSPAEGDLCMGVFVVGACDKVEQIQRMRAARLPAAEIADWR